MMFHHIKFLLYIQKNQIASVSVQGETIIKIYDLDYKLRNILIDYFKDVDTIPITKKIKVTQNKL